MPSRRNGFALISVLWMGFLLILLTGSVLLGVRVQSQTTANNLEHAKARSLAEAGLVQATERLRETVADATWHGNGVTWDYRFAGGTVRVSVQDEGGKIDLNRGSNVLLKSLFVANGASDDQATDLVDAIADWRDRNDLKRLNGAEDRDYRNAGLDYGAKDSPFERVHELRRVLGMSDELFREVAPALTVYSSKAGIDVNAAPREALRALPDVTPEELDRRFTGGGGQTDDNGPMRLGPLVTTSDRRLVSRSSRRTFTLGATAATAGGAIFTRQAVVRLSRGRAQPIRILEWRSGGETGPKRVPSQIIDQGSDP